MRCSPGSPARVAAIFSITQTVASLNLSSNYGFSIFLDKRDTVRLAHANELFYRRPTRATYATRLVEPCVRCNHCRSIFARVVKISLIVFCFVFVASLDFCSNASYLDKRDDACGFSIAPRGSPDSRPGVVSPGGSSCVRLLSFVRCFFVFRCDDCEPTADSRSWLHICRRGEISVVGCQDIRQSIERGAAQDFRRVINGRQRNARVQKISARDSRRRALIALQHRDTLICVARCGTMRQILARKCGAPSSREFVPSSAAPWNRGSGHSAT